MGLAIEQNLEGTGLSVEAMRRYVRRFIYSLPGTDRHPEHFSILLTGSRASGHHRPDSDVDLEVLCPQELYDSVLAACLESGRTPTAGTSFFNTGPEGVEIFGGGIGYPHFSLTPLERIAAAIRRWDDVTMWIIGRARVLTDPGGQFAALAAQIGPYPRDVLVRKLKYHYLLEMYWSIDVTPHHPTRQDELLPAATGLLNSMIEQLRLFYLVEGKPFPYTEALTRHAGETALGRRFLPFLVETTERIVGCRHCQQDARERLAEAFRVMHCSDTSPRSAEYFDAVDEAMVAAGVESEWVANAYQSIDELLLGRLGPMP